MALRCFAAPQELETLVAYLGLDWNNEEVDSFLQSRGSCSLLQFMSTFVRIIEQVRAVPVAARRGSRLTDVCSAGRRDGHEDAHG